jgi:hypothetical protein
MGRDVIWWRRGRRPALPIRSGSQEDPDAEDRDVDDRVPVRHVSRRVFLRNGSLTVAAAGLVSAMPGLPALLSEVAPDAPAADTAAADASGLASGPLAESLVVQVRNLQTGDMSLYLGEREILYRDPGLASRIMHATG